MKLPIGILRLEAKEPAAALVAAPNENCLHRSTSRTSGEIRSKRSRLRAW